MYLKNYFDTFGIIDPSPFRWMNLMPKIVNTRSLSGLGLAGRFLIIFA